MSLQNLQADVAEAIFSGSEEIENITPPAHLAIYHHNVIATLTNALRAIYPFIVKLVGDDFFVSLAHNYIQSFPARSGNLYEYGEYFSHFIKEYQPLNDIPYLSEVAQYEWAAHQIYFASAHTGMDISLLETLSPDKYASIYFLLHPACHIFQFNYPIHEIIELCKNEPDDVSQINAGGVNLMIIRRELETEYELLSIGEYAFLNALQENKPLVSALDIATHSDPEFNLENVLIKRIQDKTIVDFHSF